MSGGRLVSFTPEEVTGIGTPVIIEHLPPGSITYNANGSLNQIGGKRRRYTKRNIRRLKRTKKINKHRRTKKVRKTKKHL